MVLVILESPYAGNVLRNINYARKCVLHSLTCGESPIASHLLYTQSGILNDQIKSEREVGLKAGLAWRKRADLQVFYVDYGISKGMSLALEQCKDEGRRYEMRSIL